MNFKKILIITGCALTIMAPLSAMARRRVAPARAEAPVLTPVRRPVPTSRPAVVSVSPELRKAAPKRIVKPAAEVRAKARVVASPERPAPRPAVVPSRIVKPVAVAPRKPAVAPSPAPVRRPVAKNVGLKTPAAPQTAAQRLAQREKNAATVISLVQKLASELITKHEKELILLYNSILLDEAQKDAYIKVFESLSTPDYAAGMVKLEESNARIQAIVKKAASALVQQIKDKKMRDVVLNLIEEEFYPKPAASRPPDIPESVVRGGSSRP